VKPRTAVPSWKADLTLAVIAFIWGSTFVVVKNALAGASTMLFLTMRFTVAAVVLSLLFRGHLVPSGPSWKRSVKGGVWAGIFLIASYFFQTQGLRFTTASKSAFITGLSVVLVPFFSALVYKKAPGISEAVGVAVAAVGMAFLTMRLDRLTIEFGDALTMLCAVGFAAHILVVGHFSGAGGFEVLSLTQIATAAVLGWSSFWWMETPRIIWSPQLISAILITSLLATALAFTAMAWAQQHTTPTHTALIFSLEPVFAWLTSWVAARETLPPAGILGAVLILCGILLVELKPFGTGRHPSEQ
jgi:drug/metabolite transporter (DMT)-like permease